MRQFQLLFFSTVLLCLPAFAQQRTVAITVDDLPYISDAGPVTEADAPMAEEVNEKLLQAFRKHGGPVTGFVIGKSAEALGDSGSDILKKWLAQGLELGNHTYSHPDINQLSISQIEEEIRRGDAAVLPFLKGTKRVEFFRFPMNHTGDTKEKHDAIAGFLKDRGEQVATCTIDNSDYLFNKAYVRALGRNDAEFARRLQKEYLAHTASEIDYYSSLNKQVLGYEPPHVMLLHDNRLNADLIEDLLKLFEDRGYKFVSLEAAQADPAYSTPDTFVSQYGPMWGYRWARERNVRVNGSLEPEPPKWVTGYASEP